MSLSLYDVLDVDPTASADEIRAAWKSAIADLGPGDRRFRAYNQAAEVLLDPERRADYDAELAAQADPETAGPDEPEPVAVAEPDPEPEPEPEPEPDEETAGESAGIATWVLAAVGVVAAAVLAVTIVVWATQDDPEPALDTEENAAAALDAAEEAAEPVLSYDYRTFAEDIVDAESYMTTSYAAEHSELMSDLRESAVTQKAIVDAQLKGSAIVRVTDDRADILILVNQVTQKTGTDNFVLPVWATLQLVLDDGEWLVDGIVNEGTVGG